ncbi:hypothetical protein COL516b_000310 [Colletotrichum fioriniae]|nr:uncharacterized protein COL516b_000310 [Colletotrichum fioriniae]KAJ0313374.1 hypothetical protein COL516b_000310 [Colletotrichum fioriniae]
MDESAKLIKSLVNGLKAINKVQAQQSKTFSELAKLCVAENAFAVDVARVKDLQDTQETLASIMSLQTKIMEEQAAVMLSRQQAAAMPSKQQEQESPSGFPKFGRLPIEIRRLIWKMALPGSRVLEQVDGEAVYPELRKGYRPPVIRAVCKEAWEVTEENGLFVYGPELTASGGTWLNPKQDVFVIRDPGAICPLGPLQDCRLEIIAVDRRYFEQDGSFERVLDCALEAYGCRKVNVLLRTAPNLRHKKGVAPKLFSLQPEDVIWSVYADDKPHELYVEDEITWEDFKDVIQDSWNDMIRKSGRSDIIMEYGGVPIIEGMELIMCKEEETPYGF